MAHELFGETLKYRQGFEDIQPGSQRNKEVVIGIENEVRAFHGMPPRTGSDHDPYTIIVRPQ
jgi:hypothetical protein